ncbi:MAG: hypothetical protein EKK64_10170 [Neisseriaceae bacterium]|nr:MAG: hypothetical protein EKK64_10170 [Neisseriaceae bacterium]
MAKLSFQQKPFSDRSSVCISENRKNIIVEYRCSPIKEGHWSRQFPKTKEGRQEAIKLFASLK